MKTGDLLKALIDAARLRQNYFAARIYMSPSMLSNIIGGKRHLKLSESEDFISSSARVLADALFGFDCHMTLNEIFPVIHEFSTKYNLEQFFSDAIRYAIDKEQAAGDFNTSNQRLFSGQPQILNMICIICSDYLAENSDEPMDIYSTLPPYSKHYENLLDGMKLSPRVRRFVTIRQLLDPEVCRAEGGRGIRPAMALFSQEHIADLYRWQAALADRVFILLKNQFVMYFNTMLDNTLHMTLVRKPSDVERFYQSLVDLMKDAVCMSAEEGDLLALLQRVPDTSSVASKIRIFAEMNWSGTPAENIRLILDTMADDGTTCYMSADVLPALLNTNQVLLAGVEDQGKPVETRRDYLGLLLDAVHLYPERLRIVNAPLGSILLLCKDELSLLGLVNPLTKKMKYHLVDSDDLRNELKRSVAGTDINTVDYLNSLVRIAM